MPTSLPTLCHYDINAALNRYLSVLGRAYCMHDDSSLSLRTRNQFSRVTPEKGNYWYALLQAGFEPFLLWKIEVQVHRKRLVRQRPEFLNLTPQCRDIGAPKMKYSQAARIAHSSCQLGRKTSATHWRLYNWDFNSELVTK